MSGKPLHYKGSEFHRVVPGFVCQAGSITKKGGESIYGQTFEDENFDIKHDKGYLSMANTGQPVSNRSQFFICLKKCSNLDGKHVVFGRVVEGMEVVQEIEKQGVAGVKEIAKQVPKVSVIISDCGQLPQAPVLKGAVSSTDVAGI